MKRWIGIILSIILIISVIGAVAVSGKEEFVREYSEKRYSEASILNWIKLPESGITEIDISEILINGFSPQIQDGTVVLKKNDTLTAQMNIALPGEYNIAVTYKVAEPDMVDTDLFVTVNSSKFYCSVPILWADDNAEYPRDKYGNELPANQVCVDSFITDYLINKRDVAKKRIDVDLKSGENSLTVVNHAEDLIIKKISIIPFAAPPDYEEYSKDFRMSEKTGFIEIQGEYYSVKSDSFIHGSAVKTLDVHPYNSFYKVINVLDSGSFSKIGQKVLWEFNAESSGWYNLSVRYSLNSDTNKPVFRRLEIDGAVPFSEMQAVLFAETKNGKYTDYTLSDGNEPYFFYLTEGVHTLAIENVMGETEEVYREIISIMEKLSSIGMQLKKLTAGNADKNKTWDMDVYLPDTVPSLKDCANRIDDLYEQLEKIGACEPVYAQNLIYAAESIRKLTDKPRTIPNNIDLISTGDNSASKYLGQILNMLTEQPVSIDLMTFYTGEYEKPADASIFKRAYEAFKAFAYTYTPEASKLSYSTEGADREILQVWVNRPIQYVDILQQLIDSDYSAEIGKPVQLSIMPNEQKLILSSAAGSNPDAVLGVNYFTPFEFAIRGAAKNLLEYDDFLPFYNEQYNLEALVPLSFQDGVYGAVETQDFQVLFYRKKILEELNISVPETWDDVYEMMPTLLRYSANFYLPLSSQTAFKSLHTTGPFIYQNGGTLYNSDGLGVAYDSDNTFAGIKAMINLYRIYGTQQTVADFYNSFRYGDTPIGISGFSTYLQMHVAAPELEGEWGITLVPGTLQEDGTILRYQMADSTACMIFDNTDKSSEAWEFLKWWLDSETQRDYSFALESTYGVAYRWNTANHIAFAQLPYPSADKEIILNQWEWQKENVRHPANYMVEREISNIWTNVIINGKLLVGEVERAATEANREIVRKLQEFGYYDSEGNVLKNYPLMTSEDLYGLLEEKQQNRGKNIG